MSVIVKGWDKPNNCRQCDFSVNGCGYLLCAINGHNLCVSPNHESCPLITLPSEHGELIDRDALLHDIEHYHLSDGKFQHWVEVQNVIVPAERSVKNELV